MDRMSDSGSDDGGSRLEKRYKQKILVPVVQWIECQIPVLMMGVRIPSGTQRGALYEVPLFYFPVLPTNSTTYSAFLRHFLQNMVYETGEVS